MKHAWRYVMRATARFFSSCLLWVSLGTSSAFADILPLPDLVVFPTNIPLNTPTTITVTLKITDPTYIPGTARLHLINDYNTRFKNNIIRKKIAKFADKGRKGDLVAGDQIYTAQITLMSPTFKEYQIIGSVAYKGIIQRVRTSLSTILATDDATANTSGVTIGVNEIRFIDAQGNPTTPLPIKSFESTNVVTDTGTNVITSDDTTMLSEQKQTVGVFTHKLVIYADGDEGDSLSTDFNYYGLDGTLLFTRTSATGRQYYIDPNKQLISADGSRVLLIEVSDEETNPSIDLMSSTGDVIANYPAPLGYSYIRKAYLSANGRYIGLIGRGVAEGDLSDLVTVIDANTGAIVTRIYSPDNPPILAENDIGSFTILSNGNAQEQLP